MLAGLLRFVRLGEPPSIMFDETYYARDACRYLGMTAEACGVPEKIVMKYLPDGGTLDTIEQSYVHPPLGKWLIAGGIALFGFDAFGWRFAAALAGTALVGVVYLLARSLFQRRLTAGLAGLLTAAEFLLIVHSRTALLDIFLAFFVTLGFLFLAKDRERVMLLRDPDGVLRGEPRRRWLRMAAGAAFGAAMAVKWSGVLALAAGGLLAVAWSASLAAACGRQPEGHRSPGLARELAHTALALGVVPALTYLAAYGPWLAGNGFDLRLLAEIHDLVLDFHNGLRAEHSYQSTALEWLYVRRPVLFWFEGDPEVAVVLGLPNIATWVAGMVAGGWMLARSLRPWRPERVLVAAWLAQYVPWLFVTRPMFLFYMVPIVPFMMTGLAAALTRVIDAGRLERWLAGAFLVIGVGVMLWFFYPILTGVPILRDLWLSRMWFQSWI